jgi:predicted transcriptional regulator
MKTVVLEVRSLSEATEDFARTWISGRGQRSARIGFASPELLWDVLSAKRWALLRVLRAAGPMSIREAARQVGRDVRGVHTDVVRLLNAGIIQRTADGLIEFPFDAVKVEVILNAA